MSGEGKGTNLKKENNLLKNQIKELEKKLDALKVELETSNAAIPRLESLCNELEKQNKTLKDESIAKMKNAEDKGNELAAEVGTSMEFMENVNTSMEKISAESKQARTKNDELATKLDKMKSEHEPKEEELKSKLEEKCDEIVKLRTEVAQAKLQNAHDKQKLFSEMQQLATTLIQSREQVKATKESELELRIKLQEYDKKFDGLQSALKDTNDAYDGFKGEMVKVCGRTRVLEDETVNWKERWAQSNISLKSAEEDHTRLQTEIAKAHEGLIKMTNLCRALQEERKQLLDALKRTNAK